MSSSTMGIESTETSRAIRTINDLPNELHFLIIQELPLVSLITSRRISLRWSKLIDSAALPHGRRELLGFYLQAVTSEAFIQTRSLLIPRLDLFGDRERYLSSIKVDVRAPLPPLFVTWVLEWPARAVIGEIWPFLAYPNFHGAAKGCLCRREGTNIFGARLIVKNLVLREVVKEGVISSRIWYGPSVDFVQEPNRAVGIVTSFDQQFNLELLILEGRGTAKSLVGKVCLFSTRKELSVGPEWVEFLRAELQREEEILEYPSVELRDH